MFLNDALKQHRKCLVECEEKRKFCEFDLPLNRNCEELQDACQPLNRNCEELQDACQILCDFDHSPN